MRTVGMIGLGLLGTALAERFQRAGFTVVGFDIDPQRCQMLSERGGRSVTAAREVARSCGRLIFSLPDTQVVESVLDEIGTDLRPGTTIIDTTTGDPERTAHTGARLSTRGIHYLDATIAGSSEQVRAGDVIVMIGGETAAAEACADLFRSFAKEWFPLGPWGSGARMKLVVNLVLGLNRAALAEGLCLARAGGLDLAQTLHVLQAGAAYSRAMDAKGRKMIDGDFQPQARLSQHLKDVRLILAEAERAQAPVPLSTVHRALLEKAEAAGWGDADNSAVIRAFDAT